MNQFHEFQKILNARGDMATHEKGGGDFPVVPGQVIIVQFVMRFYDNAPDAVVYQHWNGCHRLEYVPVRSK